MYSVIKTAVVCGFESLPVQVETDVSDGMPSFDMEIGRASCRERV